MGQSQSDTSHTRGTPVGVDIKRSEIKNKKTMVTLTESKKKEWRDWGKEAYKSCANRMRRNSHHPEYDTAEKREAIHDTNEKGEGESDYNFTEKGMKRLKARWNYSDEAIGEAKEEWIKGYKASRKWYAREDAKQQAVIDKYIPIFETAAEIALAVDVSDIRDGFPCGSAHLYLQRYPEVEDLYKALGHFNSDRDMEQYKRELPIKMPSYGQCINFDTRICLVVGDFLQQQGIFTNTHKWID